MHFTFSICSERSGSNLIAKIMDAHPEVCGPFPSHLMWNLAPNLFRYGDLRDDENWRMLLEDVVFLLDNGISQWVSSFTVAQLAAEVTDRRLDAVYRYVYETEAQAQGKARLFIKENHSYEYIGFILSHFPDAKFTWMVRDPRDMVHTWKSTGQMAGGVRHAARYWKEDQRHNMAIYGYLRELGKIHFLRFEDLLSAAEPELRKICSFLGTDYSPAMLDFHQKDLTKRNASTMGPWQDLQKPLITENKNLYRQGLNETEIRYIEALCWEEMRFCGYAPDYAESGDADALEARIMADEPEVTRTAAEKTRFHGYTSAVERIRSRMNEPA